MTVVALDFTAAALAYFRTHAIDPHTAAALGVRQERGVLVFPYVSTDGVPFERRRQLTEGGEKVRQPRGSR
jgi:nucleoside 2-deoxyribosyltransferase